MAAKVPAVGISPFPSAMTSGKKLSLAGSMSQVLIQAMYSGKINCEKIACIEMLCFNIRISAAFFLLAFISLFGFILRPICLISSMFVRAG